MRVSDTLRRCCATRPVAFIIVLAALEGLMVVLLGGYKIAIDTPSYISAYRHFLSGQIDILRTPVYPFFVGMVQDVMGPRYYAWGVVALQYALFFGTIKYFYALAMRVAASPRRAFVATLCFALLPGISSWCSTLLTETLALLGSVMLLYHLVRAHDTRRVIHALAMTVWLVFLIFLRPVFVYALPILAVVWTVAVFEGRGSRRVALASLAGVVVASMLLLGYMRALQAEHGLFAQSNVSDINLYYLERYDGLMNPSFVEDAPLREKLERFVATHGEKVEDGHLIWGEWFDLKDNHSPAAVHQAIQASYQMQPLRAASKVGGRFYRVAMTAMFETRHPVWDTINDVLSPSMSVLYLLLATYGVLLVWTMLRQRRWPWLSVLMVMLGVANLVTAVVGAQSEWGRLVVPSLPIYMLMLLQLLKPWHWRGMPAGNRLFD
ncbi:MAG: glycosyltransferase family 39 protein [Muribaculaceae bacterium]|nr:glycosyltransferase family 39 protein [Muribaculaceae bacterium]